MRFHTSKLAQFLFIFVSSFLFYVCYFASHNKESFGQMCGQIPLSLRTLQEFMMRSNLRELPKLKDVSNKM